MVGLGMPEDAARAAAASQAAAMAEPDVMAVHLSVTGCGADEPPSPPPVNFCAGIEAVCVESDLVTMREADGPRGDVVDSLSQGCQCCFMANSHSDFGPMETCIMPLVQSVDFCADPGGGMNNNEASVFECRHPCETGDWDSQIAAGCHGDDMGNPHDDHVCVVEQVWAPGQDMWGGACCDWCGDNDGDGIPDYEGCCTGMRTDGEMGCEWTNCLFMCNGLECYRHEDQATCEGNGGTWEAAYTCMDAIANQPGYAGELGDVGATVWLGHFGATCCQMDADGTPYEPPGAGSCNDADVAVYVRFLAWVWRVVRWMLAMSALC